MEENSIAGNTEPALIEQFCDLFEVLAISEFFNITQCDYLMNDDRTIGNAETALLGLLAEGPKHAYQIEKDVEFRAMRIWTDLSMSSIYKLLNRLEAEGLVASAMEQSDSNKLRRVYKLTETGEKALAKSIRGIFTETVIAKNPFDVAIYFSDNLSNEQLVDGMSEYQGELEKKISEYEGLGKYLEDVGCGTGPQGLAARTVAMLKGELDWLRSHIELMQNRTK